MSQTPYNAYKRAINQLEKISGSAIKSVSKGPGTLAKLTRNARLAASSVVQAATTAGAVSVPRKKKGGAKKMTRRMSSSRSKRMTRRK